VESEEELAVANNVCIAVIEHLNKFNIRVGTQCPSDNIQTFFARTNLGLFEQNHYAWIVLHGTVQTSRPNGLAEPSKHSLMLLCVVDLGALEGVAGVDVDGLPGGVEVEGAEAFAVTVAGLFDAAKG
jgi:hypothetical protein